MASHERENLLILEGETEMHINPKKIKVSGLRELLRHQIFAESPVSIILMAGDAKLVLSEKTIRGARNLFGKDRKLFLDKTARAMHYAEEIIILKGRGINKSSTRRLNDPYSLD